MESSVQERPTSKETSGNSNRLLAQRKPIHTTSVADAQVPGGNAAVGQKIVRIGRSLQ